MEKALESDDCISRKAVLKLVKIGGKYNYYTDSFITYDGKSLYETIRDLPSMESGCVNKRMNYCPNCGVKL